MGLGHDNDVPVERRLGALESIVSQTTQRNLMLKSVWPADVIVARGNGFSSA